MGSEVDLTETKKEIYTYDAGFRIYAMNWSVRPDRPFRMALSSFSESQDNKVRVVQLNDDKGAFDVLSEVEHPYPATNLKWIPDKVGSRMDMFATTADYLRLWRVSEDGKTTLRSTLQNVRQTNTLFSPFPALSPSLCSSYQVLLTLISHSYLYRTKTASSALHSLHSTGTKTTRSSLAPPQLTQPVPSGISTYAPFNSC